jgi:hypothetical protein
MNTRHTPSVLPVLQMPVATNNAQQFETVLTGTVVMSSLFTRRHEQTSAALFTHLHVVAKQENGQLFEAVQMVGSGPDAETRGAVMRGRVKPGVRIEAHGAFVGLAGHDKGDPPRLFLHGVTYIRSDPRPAPTPNVINILQRMSERVPALARGLQNTATAANGG